MSRNPDILDVRDAYLDLVYVPVQRGLVDAKVLEEPLKRVGGDLEAWLDEPEEIRQMEHLRALQAILEALETLNPRLGQSEEVLEPVSNGTGGRDPALFAVPKKPGSRPERPASYQRPDRGVRYPIRLGALLDNLMRVVEELLLQEMVEPSTVEHLLTYRNLLISSLAEARDSQDGVS